MNKLIFSSLIMFALGAQAQTSTATLPPASETNTSTTTVKDVINKKFEENHDITDAKLKADAGSLSRYSLKFNLTYTGPTLSDLSAKDQPNPDGTIGSFQTALGGSMGMRYRLDSKSSVGIATGLKAIHPFHGAERMDVSNPSITYDYSTRVGGVQMKNTPGVVIRTVPEFQKVSQYAQLYDNHSVVYDFGATGFATGFDFGVGLPLYSRDYETTDGKAARYTFEFNPNLKYNFSDKLSVVTISSIVLWNPRGREDQFALLNRSINQKVGLGYAVKRDIYLNPYLTFYPQHLAWSGVTFNFSTIFSIF